MRPTGEHGMAKFNQVFVVRNTQTQKYVLQFWGETENISQAHVFHSYTKALLKCTSPAPWKPGMTKHARTKARWKDFTDRFQIVPVTVIPSVPIQSEPGVPIEQQP